ncbi:hypothetical protein [Nocardioides yefusunii]|uniref:DUF2207 domain-containing protein n=1 Tax=Nocardioides yefusunii TaxID=2500546 RepID=A0ABW1R265_9ACTN|nr:hypothetical protein [Nocardioides yefusunii]
MTDPSALIFIALAVAWAAYLVPKAFKSREELERASTSQRIADRVRVLARREPTSSKDARLVVTPAAAPVRPGAPSVADAVRDAERPSEQTGTRALPVVSQAARRAAASAAARRRRNVLTVLVAVWVMVAGVVTGGLLSAWWLTAPTALIAAWLVTCRLTVRRERRPAGTYLLKTPDLSGAQRSSRNSYERSRFDEVETQVAMAPVAYEMDDETGEITPISDDPSRWDMVPVTLPTYVTAPVADRTVHVIDLDSTGVWTSGRTREDAELAKQDELRRRWNTRVEDQGDEPVVEQRLYGS